MKCVASGVGVVRIRDVVLMEDHGEIFVVRELHAMKEPHMTSVLWHQGDVVLTHKDDVEVVSIYVI